MKKTILTSFIVSALCYSEDINGYNEELNIKTFKIVESVKKQTDSLFEFHEEYEDLKNIPFSLKPLEMSNTISFSYDYKLLNKKNFSKEGDIISFNGINQILDNNLLEIKTKVLLSLKKGDFGLQNSLLYKVPLGGYEINYEIANQYYLGLGENNTSTDNYIKMGISNINNSNNIGIQKMNFSYDYNKHKKDLYLENGWNYDNHTYSVFYNTNFNGGTNKYGISYGYNKDRLNAALKLYHNTENNSNQATFTFNYSY